MDNNKVEVEVTLNNEDAYNSLKAVFYKQLSPIFIIIFSSIFVIMAAASIAEKPPLGKNPFITVLFILFPIYFIAFLPLKLKKSARIAFNTNKLLQKTQKYKIDNEGINVCSESAQAQIKWDELYKAIETKDGFLFYISKQQMYIIPKRCLDGGSEQFDLLRAYIRNTPFPKKEKGGLLGRGFKTGCLIYILLFIVLLVIFTLLQAK